MMEPAPRRSPSPPRTPSELPSPFSSAHRARSNFDENVEAGRKLTQQLSNSNGGKRVVEHATSRGQKGGRTAMQHLVGDSSIVDSSIGTLLQHGGIYAEATVTIDEAGDTIP